MDLNEFLVDSRTQLQIQPIYKPHPKTSLQEFQHFHGRLCVDSECVVSVEGDSVEEVTAELNSVLESKI